MTIDLKLSIKQQELSFSGLSAVLSCGVGGARHPCDPTTQYNLIGDVSKNPALLPVLNHLKCALTDSIARHLPVDVATTRFQGVLEPIDHSQGFSLNRQFSYRRGENDGLAEDAKLIRAFHAIKADVDAAVPEIQSMIDAKRQFQLPLEPGPLTMKEFEAQAAKVWQAFKDDVTPDMSIKFHKDDRFNLS